MNSKFPRLIILVVAVNAMIFFAGFIFGDKHFDNFFPLQEGLQLQYEVKRTKDGKIIEQNKEIVTNLAEETMEGKRVVVRRYEMGGRSFQGYFNKDNEGIMFFATKAEKDAKPTFLATPFYYIKNPLKLGAAWGPPEGPKGTVESISETVTVPAGTFKNCIKVKITYPQTMPMNEGTFWFAEKVGIVKSSYVYKDSLKEDFQLLSVK